MKPFESFPVAGGVAAQPTHMPLPPTGDMSPATDDSGIPPAIESVVGGDLSLPQREDRLGALLETSVADRTLGQAEYRRASDELAAIKATEDRLHRRNHFQLTDTDTFRLENRIKPLATSIRWKP